MHFGCWVNKNVYEDNIAIISAYVSTKMTRRIRRNLIVIMIMLMIIEMVMMKIKIMKLLL